LKFGNIEKAFAAALSMFIIVAVFGFCLVDTVGLALFNMMFGNQIYTVTIAYHAVPDYNFKGELASLYFEWNITLGKAKVPIETILRSYKVKELPHSYWDLNPVNVSLHTVIYVANRIKLFENTFKFEDANPKEITIYVYRLDTSHGRVFVEINGYYQLGGEQVPLNVGADFNIET